MPFQVSTVMVDYQLESVPSDEQLVNGVVKPFSKLTKTEFVQVRAENSLREIQVIGQQGCRGKPYNISSLSNYPKLPKGHAEASI